MSPRDDSFEGWRSTVRSKNRRKISPGALVEIGRSPGAASHSSSTSPISSAVAASSGSLRIMSAALRAVARRNAAKVAAPASRALPPRVEPCVPPGVDLPAAPAPPAASAALTAAKLSVLDQAPESGVARRQHDPAVHRHGLEHPSVVRHEQQRALVARQR